MDQKTTLPRLLSEKDCVNGNSEDFKKRFDEYSLWIKISSDEIKARCAYNIGFMYAQSLYKKKNLKKATEYLQLAIKYGLKNPALYTLALVYRLNEPDKYLDTLEEAMEYKIPEAYCRMAHEYMYGEFIEIDMEKPNEYYDKAISLGHKKAEKLKSDFEQIYKKFLEKVEN